MNHALFSWLKYNRTDCSTFNIWLNHSWKIGISLGTRVVYQFL